MNTRQHCSADTAELKTGSSSTFDMVATLEPKNGIIQPPFILPEGEIGRVTNKLLYLEKTVIRTLMNHRYAGPFKRPVDAKKLKIPDYYRVITNPMDFGTIKKRLYNRYYQNADECIRDFITIFTNCYKYNHYLTDVFEMGQILDMEFLKLMQHCPKEEVEMVCTISGRGKKRKQCWIVKDTITPPSNTQTSSDYEGQNTTVPMDSGEVKHNDMIEDIPLLDF